MIEVYVFGLHWGGDSVATHIFLTSVIPEEQGQQRHDY